MKLKRRLSGPIEVWTAANVLRAARDVVDGLRLKTWRHPDQGNYPSLGLPRAIVGLYGFAEADHRRIVRQCVERGCANANSWEMAPPLGKGRLQFDAGQITLIDKNDPRYKLTITGKGSASFVRDALDLAIEAVESVAVPHRPDRASVGLRLTPEE